MPSDNGNSISSLRKIWLSLLDEEKIISKCEDEEFQGLLMLLEIALHKARSMSSLNCKLKISNEVIQAEIKERSDNINKLKDEIHRLENMPCQKCSTLEAEVKLLKKKAYEAQSRMKSIANILRLGDNIEESQSPRKNSALNLVSQMLLEESPRRKKRCIPKTTNSWKTSPLPEEVDIGNCTTIVPETSSVSAVPTPASPSKDKQNIEEIITSPDDLLTKNNSSKHKLMIDLKSLSQESPIRAKRCLNSSLNKESSNSPKNSIIPETEQNSMELNGSLADYVREANSELDKIWFTGDSSKNLEISGKENLDTVITAPIDPGENMIDRTPDKTPGMKKKTVWKMKEIRGPSESAGSRKLRQMTLSLGRRQTTKEVDLSKLSGFDGGASGVMEAPSGCKNPVEPSTSRDKPPTVDRQNTKVSETDEDALFADINSIEFKPKATSTQRMDFDKAPIQEKRNESPKFKYRRDTVRKKSERAKLEGWDCEKCAEYYKACGETSPSRVKGRLNKCSRHRDKFRPDNNTPPGYWNPIFPDTQECREQGMYTSFHCKRDK